MDHLHAILAVPLRHSMRTHPQRERILRRRLVLPRLQRKQMGARPMRSTEDQPMIR